MIDFKAYRILRSYNQNNMYTTENQSLNLRYTYKKIIIVAAYLIEEIMSEMERYQKHIK